MASRVAPCPLPLFVTVPPESGGIRLDAALGLVWPGAGLRARRRLWEYCRVTVNGRARKPGFAVAEGDVIRVQAVDASSPRDIVSGGLELAAEHRDYLAFVKPCGLHSAHVGGSLEPSLEAMLPRSHILLTRLDKSTSGLVLAARSRGAAAHFRDLETRGGVEKRYMAVVRGRLESVLTLAGRLLVANTLVTRVLEEPDPDPVRHSVIEPLNRLPAGWPEFSSGTSPAMTPDIPPITAPGTAQDAPPAGPARPPGCIAPGGIDLTLVRVTIRRGARHQIRAHLAHAGHPLLGEDLYAGPLPGVKPGCLYLHHGHLTFPSFEASCPPPWTGACRG